MVVLIVPMIKIKLHDIRCHDNKALIGRFQRGRKSPLITFVTRIA